MSERARPEAPLRRISHNALLNILGQALPLIVTFFTIPIVIRGLGTARFGVFAIGWVIFAFFNVFELGLGRATTKFVAEALGRGSDEEVPSLVWTSIALQLVLGALAGSILWVAAAPIVQNLLNVPFGLQAEARGFLHVLAFTVPIALAAPSLRGGLEAAQRFDLVNLVLGPFSVSYSLLSLTGVLLGFGLPGIGLLLLGNQLGAFGVYYAFCRRALPGLRGRPKFDHARMRTMLGFGGWIAVSSFVSPILVYLDRLIIGAVLSVSAVAYYAPPYEVATRMWIIASSLTAVLFPVFSSRAIQPAADFSSLISRSTKFVLLALGFMATSLASFAPLLFKIWLGEDFVRQSTAPLQILAAGVVIISMAFIPYAFLQGVGRPDITAKLHLVELPLHAVLVFALVAKFGITGAAIAWLIRAVIDCAGLFLISARVSSVSIRSFIAPRVPVAAVILMSVAAAGITANLIDNVALRTALQILLLGSLGMVIWRFLILREDRAEVVVILRTMLGPLSRRRTSNVQ